MIPTLDPAACRQRRERLLSNLAENGHQLEAVVVSRPEHVYYLTGFLHDANNIHNRAPQYLIVDADGRASVVLDGFARDRGRVLEASGCEALSAGWRAFDPLVPRTAKTALATANALTGFRRVGIESAHLPAIAAAGLADPVDIEPVITKMRRRKDPDELNVIRAAIGVGERFHAASRELARAGVREIDLYAEIVAEATKTAEQPLVMMCDFRAGPHMRQGGAATERVIEPGDNLLLDIYPYMNGYRCDITNTINIGGKPTARQEEAMAAAIAGMRASEAIARPGATAHEIYEAQTDAIAEFDPQWKQMQGHAGHSLGLEHPEAPDFQAGNMETLTEGDVITFEPHVFGDPFQGCRIEHNYLVTADGLKCLSSHEIGLC